MPIKRAGFGFQWSGGIDRDKKRHDERHLDDPEAEARQTAYRTKLGVAKMISHMKSSEKGECEVQKNSVYGAAIAMPQIARSGGWPRMLKVLAIRSYVFLLINFVAQGSILYMIAKEELIWDLFAGQMYLCDMGAQVDSCPDGPNCVGPSRTIINPSRIYEWSSYSLRNYARDSLKALFPHKAAEINEKLDPGEYGVESYWCRVVCCTLFMVSVMQDLRCCIDMARLLFLVPNKPEAWISYEAPNWADKDHAKSVHGWSEFDLVKLKVAGMSLGWKMINFCVVLLPKVLLWKVTCEAGVSFLMETSGMEDTIVNSVALAFILNIDEMLFEELMSEDTKAIINKVDAFTLDDENEFEHVEDETIMDHHDTKEDDTFRLTDVWKIIPFKLVVVLCMTAFFVLGYYRRSCVRNERGGFVSRAMHLPKSTGMDLWTAYFPTLIPVEAAAEAYWEYAPPGG